MFMTSKDYKIIAIMNRRIFLVFAIQGIFFLILAYRLFYLQVVKHSSYQSSAENNHIRVIVEPVPRGIIVDSQDKILADNSHQYLLIIDMKEVSQLDDFFDRMEQIFDIEDREKDAIVANIKKKKRFIEFRSISFEEFLNFQYQIDHLPEILVSKKYIRIYPYHDIAAHVVGYISNENKKYDNNYFIYSNNFKIGKTGIESKFNQELTGTNQIMRISVDAKGNKIKELDVVNGEPGQKIHTSINIDLQKMIFDEFNTRGSSGSAVVIDIKNQKLISMVNAPSFDPEIFDNEVLRKSSWAKLATDESHPLINKAISGLYSPGSAYKIVVALAALQLGIINEKSTIFCSGGYQVGNRFYRCLHYHGTINVSQAISKSCNSFFYSLSKKMNIGFLEKLSLSLGFGRLSDLQMDGEYKGIVPSKLWKLKRFSSLWYIGDTANLLIGQGYLSCNPLQMAISAASIASGKIMKLSVLANETPEIEENNLIDEKNWNIVRKAMFDVVNKDGTAYYSLGLKYKDLGICGKTGTVQISSGKKHKNHSVFVGFAPFDDPKYALSVIGEFEGYGSSFSAPLAGKIFKDLLG